MTEAIGWTLVQFLWQGAVIGLVTAGVLAIIPNRARLRYVVACLGLLTMVGAVSVTGALEVGKARREPLPPAQLLPPPPIDGRARTPSVPVRSVPPAQTFAVSDSTFAWPRVNLERWLPVAVSLWALGVAFFSLKLLAEWLVVQRIRHGAARPLSGEWQRAVVRLAHGLRVARPVRLVESSLVDVPTVVGWLRPVILLPASAVTGLAPSQLEAIIAHELAHVLRQDYLANLLQSVAETLLFYHPAVWWVSRCIRIEREHCCDDIAIATSGDRVAYARALTTLEALRQDQMTLVVAASGGSLLQRIQRVLGRPSAERRSPAWVACGVVAALLVLFLVPPATTNAQWPPADLNTVTGSAQRPLRPFIRGDRGTVQNGRYHHNETDIEFLVPPGWEFTMGGPSSDGGDGALFHDPLSGNALFVWLIREGKTPENARASSVDDVYRHTIGMKIRQRLDSGWMDYWVPEDTIDEPFIHGRKALVATGRFRLDGVEMAERLAWIYTDQARVFFRGHVPLDQYADYQRRVDDIIATAIVP